MYVITVRKFLLERHLRKISNIGILYILHIHTLRVKTETFRFAVLITCTYNVSYICFFKALPHLFENKISFTC